MKNLLLLFFVTQTTFPMITKIKFLLEQTAERFANNIEQALYPQEFIDDSLKQQYQPFTLPPPQSTPDAKPSLSENNLKAKNDKIVMLRYYQQLKAYNDLAKKESQEKLALQQTQYKLLIEKRRLLIQDKITKENNILKSIEEDFVYV